jgi:hypothetical protein
LAQLAAESRQHAMFALRACSRAAVALPCAAAVLKGAPALCSAKVHTSPPRLHSADRYETPEANPELRLLFENNRKWVRDAAWPAVV